MVTERLTHFIEKRGLIRLENKIIKTEINEESLIAVFFDVEKAYDMMLEGFLIYLKMMGVEGRVFNWVKDFMAERSIQIKLENGTPRGSVISPLIFSAMINNVFSQVEPDIGRSLFADDGALRKEEGISCTLMKGSRRQSIR